MIVRARIERPTMSPSAAGIRLTPKEFDAIDDWVDGYRYELINGVLVVSPPALESQSGPNDTLGYWLRHYQEYHRRGRALDETLPEYPVATKKNRRNVDRAIWTGLGREMIPQVDMPSVLVEFVSKGKRNWQRDYLEKRDEFKALGIQEYWVIDRFRRIMTVFRREGNGWLEIIVRESETYKTPLLPGFELPLGELLKVADKLKRRKHRD